MTDLILAPGSYEPNAADGLANAIARFQAKCAHSFIRTTPLSLRESLVAGVYIGEAEHGHHGPEPITFASHCIHCSLEKHSSVLRKCPKCRSAMRPEGDLEARNRYQKPNPLRGHYGARVYSCMKPECGLKIVIDEVDFQLTD